MVEHLPSKQAVAGSSPVSRSDSTVYAWYDTLTERLSRNFAFLDKAQCFTTP